MDRELGSSRIKSRWTQPGTTAGISRSFKARRALEFGVANGAQLPGGWQRNFKHKDGRHFTC